MAAKRQESSPVISSFPRVPLTTTFTATDSRCGGLYTPSASRVYMIDDEPSCLPPGFSTAATDFYYSPGIACPSGYWTACYDTTGVPSITTVTCCPTYLDISLACVPDPESLSSGWESLQCTWVAPRTTTLIEVTESMNDDRTSIVRETFISPGGINAYGIRMVHQATDLVEGTTALPETTSSSTTTTAANTPGPGPGSGSGLSTGATVAIGVVIPVVVLAALTIGVAWWWRTKRQRPSSEYMAAAPVSLPSEPQPEVQMKPYPGDVQQPHELSSLGHHLAVEMPSTREAAELPGDWTHGR
ncbi:Phosphoinositide 3-kinase regulatory subunit 5 [Madurella mycetomatis]|uniref:Phosphoinositide 3-kinase regulatory subunit 5 n=1 Tax=Madurella mycetomatis TaxID=100816 RepID=A0A175VXK2_9PEZI|nr:Phosphoinositide 3-kinase regulatory subunit 5 [Madurella mycetomatis]